MAKKKDLKASVEKQISEMLDSKDEPSDGRLKLLALGIKMCALNAKLEENEYGDFFGAEPAAGEAGGVPAEGTKHRPRRRANGSGEPAIES